MTRPEVIYPNFRLVQSGVSTTVFQLARAFQRRRDVASYLVGYGFPEDLKPIPLAGLARRLLNRREPVVWHARRNIEMLAGIALRGLGANLKLVFTSAAQRHHTRYTHWLMRQMDKIVFTSKRSAGFVPLPGPVVGHGVDLPPPIDRAEQKKKLGLDPSAHYVASFGAIRASKGTDLLVDALIDVLPERPNWRALIVGPCDAKNTRYLENLVERVRRNDLVDRITFLGNLRDASLHLQSVDICVAPSRVEGFGLTALEAMAASVPVVASGAGSYPETIIQGTTGLITETGNMGALAAAIRSLMDDDYQRQALGAAGRRHVQQHWSIDREAEALIGVYSELVGIRPDTMGAGS